MGLYEPGESFLAVAASFWISSSLNSTSLYSAPALAEEMLLESVRRLNNDEELEEEPALLPWPEERCKLRTTSPLQIGHVRRRVVNHGVLEIKLVSTKKPSAAKSAKRRKNPTKEKGQHSHALNMKLMPAR
jgi:hypothetical protein